MFSVITIPKNQLDNVDAVEDVDFTLLKGKTSGTYVKNSDDHYMHIRKLNNKASYSV